MKEDSKKHLEKSYFDVLGLCCSSEVSLIEKILTPLEGVHNVSVIVPSRTVIVVHDATLISQFQIGNDHYLCICICLEISFKLHVSNLT